MKKRILIATIIISGIVAAMTACLNHYYNRSIGFMCSGDYTSRKSNDNGIITELNVKMMVILNDDGNGVLLQQGEVLNGKDTYIIDREITLTYNELAGRGFHAEQIKHMIRRKADNTPRSVAINFPILGEIQNTMYVNITSVNRQAYLFNELSVPYFLCNKP